MFRSILSYLARDERGGAAIEFAIIAPVMLLIFFGTAELSQGIQADRKVTLAAGAISDIVARTDTINTDGLRNIFTAATYILRPFPPTNFKATITAIDIDSKGVSSVSWKVNMAWSGGSASATVSKDKTVGTIPNDIKVPGRSLIKSDVSYPYETSSKFFIKTLSLTETFFARPRRDSGKVDCSTCS